MLERAPFFVDLESRLQEAGLFSDVCSPQFDGSEQEANQIETSRLDHFCTG